MDISTENHQKLTAMGAQTVAGVVFLSAVEMGTFGPDGLTLTPEGVAALAAAVAVAPPGPPPAPKTKAKPKAVVADPVVSTEPSAADLLAELDTL